MTMLRLDKSLSQLANDDISFQNWPVNQTKRIYAQWKDAYFPTLFASTILMSAGLAEVAICKT